MAPLSAQCTDVHPRHQDRHRKRGLATPGPPPRREPTLGRQGPPDHPARLGTTLLHRPRCLAFGWLLWSSSLCHLESIHTHGPTTSLFTLSSAWLAHPFVKRDDQPRKGLRSKPNHLFVSAGWTMSSALAQLPGLGGRAHCRAARGVRAGACARRRQPCRGRVRRLTDSAVTGFAPPEPSQGPSGCPVGSTEPVSGRMARRAGSGRDESARHRHGRERWQPEHPVADRGCGGVPPGGEHLDAGRRCASPRRCRAAGHRRRRPVRRRTEPGPAPSPSPPITGGGACSGAGSVRSVVVPRMRARIRAPSRPRAPRTMARDVHHLGGVVAAVLAMDVLDHLIAPRVQMSRSMSGGSCRSRDRNRSNSSSTRVGSTAVIRTQ